MVNYHTSTLLESSEHVFELIRYIFFWGAPPYQVRLLVYELKSTARRCARARGSEVSQFYWGGAASILSKSKII